LLRGVCAGADIGGMRLKIIDIVPSYVSPMQYDAYNCQQLAEEFQRIMPPKPLGSKTVRPQGRNNIVLNGIFPSEASAWLEAVIE
jgi:hypothetical protein